MELIKILFQSHSHVTSSLSLIGSLWFIYHVLMLILTPLSILIVRQFHSQFPLQTLL